jgi:Ferritin-like domain
MRERVAPSAMRIPPMHHMWNDMKTEINRRSFVKNGLSAAGIATAGIEFLANGSSLLADEGPEERGGNLSRGDAALLRFAAAAEILETDFWVQYNELGGIQDKEEPSGSGNPAYTAALAVLDEDMAQYVHDNTDDEFTHQNFLNAYLTSKGAEPVSLEAYPEALQPAPAENVW